MTGLGIFTHGVGVGLFDEWAGFEAAFHSEFSPAAEIALACFWRGGNYNKN